MRGRRRSFDVAVVYERQIDVAAERERLTKDLAKFEKGLAAAERQLGNEAFMAKAPAHIVDGLRKQAAETKMLHDKTKAALEALPPMDGFGIRIRHHLIDRMYA